MERERKGKKRKIILEKMEKRKKYLEIGNKTRLDTFNLSSIDKKN